MISLVTVGPEILVRKVFVYLLTLSDVDSSQQLAPVCNLQSV